MQKEDILAEVRRTAQENDGKPLGLARFERLTGIRPYDWRKYWTRFSEAQREAGFEPNKLIEAYPENYLLEKLAQLSLELHKFPAQSERVFKRHNDTDFPDSSVYERKFNSQKELATKLMRFCEGRPEFAQVLTIAAEKQNQYFPRS